MVKAEMLSSRIACTPSTYSQQCSAGTRQSAEVHILRRRDVTWLRVKVHSAPWQQIACASRPDNSALSRRQQHISLSLTWTLTRLPLLPLLDSRTLVRACLPEDPTTLNCSVVVVVDWPFTHELEVDWEDLQGKLQTSA